MEPTYNPLVPDNSDKTTPPKPASPYTPSEPGAKAEQLTNSTFQSRTIAPLEPATAAEPLPPAPSLNPVSADLPVAQPSAVPEPVLPTITANPVPPSGPLPQPSAVPEPVMPPVPAGPAPVVGNAFVGADLPTDPNQQIFQPVMPPSNGMPPPKQGRRLSLKSKPALLAIAVIFLIGGFAAYYFGYKTNPTVIYSQAMSNTSKGYEKLIEYTDEQAKADYKGTAGKGSFKLTTGETSTDGKIAFKSDDKNGELTFDIGLAGSRLTFDGRLIESGAGSPDIYLKAGGLKGIGSLLGTTELDAPLAKLDNTWIVIDHTLLDSLNAASASDKAESMLPPSAKQIMSAARGFGQVNQDYLFTTDQDKAVMRVTKKHGIEEVDGHKTYHYTVALNKEQVKNYIDAQKSALKASELNKWLKANGYQSLPDEMFDSLKLSADSIKSTDTFDMWADIDQRIIYKVRFAEKSNPASNFVDIGLDYKGGSDFPFFLAAQSKTGKDKMTAKAVINLNTDTQATTFSLDVRSSGTEDGTFNMQIGFKPTKDVAKIEKPANAKTLAQALSELGYGDLIPQLQAYSSSATAD